MNKQINEQKLYDFWQNLGLFKANPESKKLSYSLLMPPPNLTGELHLGHAMQHAIMDALARFKRMQGFDVLLLPGVDHASIQFENALIKILSKEGLTKEKLGKEKFLERAWKFKEEIYQSFHKDWTLFGISADWSREVFTMDKTRNKAVFEEFKKYYDDGLIYKGAYIVQWCSKCGTAIEDVEMEYEERKEKLYYLKYGPFTLATTRPETKFGDTAMAVNPKDKRYTQYIGQEFEIDTLAGKKKMKVVADEVVDPKFGTGVIKVTPGHDFDDYGIGQRHNLPVVNVINKEGRLTEVAGKYAGMKVFEAREAMIPDLEGKGILVKIEDYTHTVPVCERCKTVIEPIISEEWFVKMKPLAEKALKHLDEINFLPKNYRKILADFMKEIHDWCISRNLWWGHPMPIWYRGKEIKISMDSPGKDWVQEEKIFDTWFSSGLWPLSTLGWPDETSEMKKYFPWDFEITAPEIKYLWIARMVMISLYLESKIPFKNMFFHGTLRDTQGRKFSKSLGNGINPNDLRDAWGTDAVRMALYSYCAPGRDGRTSRQLMDERCRNFRNFGTKIKNIYKFIYELKPADAVTKSDFSHQEDSKIIQSLNGTIDRVTHNLESYQLHLATEELYDFVWNKFANSYLEWSKKRRTEAQPCLEHIFETCLKLLHPFMPFLTEELWQKMENKEQKSIMQTAWPKSRA